jgi:hypothetical protein
MEALLCTAMLYNSIKETPNYPLGFTTRWNGKTPHQINNRKLLEMLRGLEPGKWKKIYQDGFDARGQRISIYTIFKVLRAKFLMLKLNWVGVIKLE